MKVLGVVLIIVGVLGGIAIAAWLGGYVMLYGGIVGAITAGQAAVWPAMAGSIIKAVLFEFGVSAGVLFGVALCFAGLEVIDR